MTKLPKYYGIYEKRASGLLCSTVEMYLPETSGDLDYWRRHSRYEVVELNGERWKERESVRFAYNLYDRAPSWFPSVSKYSEHFAHISNDNPLFIAYTPDAEKGKADRQIKLKPGKYLKKFYSDYYDDNAIAELATRWAAEMTPPDLLIATTADEIERVYLEGPNSCMSYDLNRFTEYGTPFHPARAYAGGDLQLGYIERDGRITARVLIWPDKKIAGRIYGDKERMAKALKANGYISGPDTIGNYYFEGARISRYPVHTGFVMPYIDAHGAVRDDGEFLILDRNGGISCQPTTGTTNTQAYCVFQNKWFRSRDGWYEVHAGPRWDRRVLMSPPRIKAQAFRCSYSRDFYLNEFKIELNDGTMISKRYESETAVCRGTGGRFLHRDLISLGDQNYSRQYLETLVTLEPAYEAAA